MNPLRIAIPSKGRLKEASEAWFEKAGHPISQVGGARGYQAQMVGMDGVDVKLLSAREIAFGVLSGQLHVGVTGLDLLMDLSPDGETLFGVAEKLGFGGADVVVAVPNGWLDVNTMADLEIAGEIFRRAHGRRLRVATKYMGLTRRFFAEKSVGEYRLIESAGATEAAPASGTADVIVDITSTGATLKANGLKILADGVILSSEACLVYSKAAEWDQKITCIFEHIAQSAGVSNENLQHFSKNLTPQS